MKSCFISIGLYAIVVLFAKFVFFSVSVCFIKTVLKSEDYKNVPTI